MNYQQKMYLILNDFKLDKFSFDTYITSNLKLDLNVDYTKIIINENIKFVSIIDTGCVDFNYNLNVNTGILNEKIY